MKLRKKTIVKYLLAIVTVLAMIPFTAGAVFASEYYDLNEPKDNTSLVLGGAIEISVTPRKFVSSKWSSWANYPNYIYIRIFKGSETEPCKTYTFIYNMDGKSVGTVSNFMMPRAVGETRSVTYSPETAGDYTIKIFWQNYDDKDAKKDPALIDTLHFTVTAPGSTEPDPPTAPEPSSGSGTTSGDSSSSSGTSSGDSSSSSGTSSGDSSTSSGTSSGSSSTSSGTNGSTSSEEIVDLPTISISRPAGAKKAIVVRWKKVSKKNKKKIAGIEIQVSLDKKFKSGVITKTAKKTATSKKITKLKRKKTYYVRVRAYKKVNGVKHVSKWSKVKAVKTK